MLLEADMARTAVTQRVIMVVPRAPAAARCKRDIDVAERTSPNRRGQFRLKHGEDGEQQRHASRPS